MERVLRAGLVLLAVLLLARAAPFPLEREDPVLAEAAAEDAEPPGPPDVDLVAGALSDLVRKDPWRFNIHPLLYVEDGSQEADGHVVQPGPGPNPDEDVDSSEQLRGVRKRSRYYRRYPWKRVTRTRGSYDPDVYMCTPSREDVIQLLVGLHRAREGDTGRTINFCNRKRPASSVFTNIRFIG